jgi:CHASE3 domain sensor protein
MSKSKKILPFLLMAGALFIFTGCASEQAEYTTNQVTDTTGNTVGSVLDATGHVIMYPFHLLGDLFS